MGQLGSLDGNTPKVHPEAWIAPGAILVGRVTLGPGRASGTGPCSGPTTTRSSWARTATSRISAACTWTGANRILGERVSLGHRATVHGRW